jgi:hypothetical protein
MNERSDHTMMQVTASNHFSHVETHKRKQFGP